MARIAGVDIPNNKRIGTSLTYIFGIGDHRAAEICTKANIDPEVQTKDLTEEQTRSIIGILDKEYQVEGTLRTENAMNIQRLMDIGCYRGLQAQAQAALPGPEHQEQRSYPQGTQVPSRRQEEVAPSRCQEV